MRFKLSVSPVIEFPVKGTTIDGGKKTAFSFVLQAARIDAQPLRDILNDDKLPTRDFLHENVKGWRDQRLVVEEETGQPAAFSPEAFDVMLSLAGVDGIIVQAYLRALIASDTLAGRAGN